jgi:hypothetical protein
MSNPILGQTGVYFWIAGLSVLALSCGCSHRKTAGDRIDDGGSWNADMGAAAIEPPGSLSSYAQESDKCANLGYGSGPIHYFCDCDGPGAQADCVSGSEDNDGTDPSKPKQKFSTALATASQLEAGGTIAFCKGGSFIAGYGTIGGWGSSQCTATDPCMIREYPPKTFKGTQKPILNYPRIANQRPPIGQYDSAHTYAKDDLIVNTDGVITHISMQNNNLKHDPPSQTNGYANREWWAQWDGDLFHLYRPVDSNIRVLNLKIQGDGSGTGVWIVNGESNVKVCNVDIDNFAIGVQMSSDGSAPITNISIRGNRITNSRTMGFLGVGDSSELAYNDFEGNGGSNNRDHSVYVSSPDHESTNFSVVGNLIRGQYGSMCVGVELVTHGKFVNYVVDGNTIEVDPKQLNGGCYGIAADNGGYSMKTYIRGAVFSRNTIRNGGTTAFTIAGCTNCLVENNLILSDWCVGPSCGWRITGIEVPDGAARASYADDVTGNVTIQNNTIWFGPNAPGGAIGIQVGIEGAGYVVANNLVYYAAASAGEGMNCFDYQRPLSSFTYIDHNACYSAAGGNWEATRGDLTAWQSYTTATFDAASRSLTRPGDSVPAALAPSDPLTALNPAFTPMPGSLIEGAGDPAHAPTFDRFGNKRHDPPDIGAVEHSP